MQHQADLGFPTLNPFILAIHRVACFLDRFLTDTKTVCVNSVFLLGSLTQKKKRECLISLLPERAKKDEELEASAHHGFNI